MNRRPRFNNKSFFAKLMLGFALVILVSFAFHAMAYSYFHHKMRTQLVESNTLRLQTLVGGYEKQFGQLKDVLTRYVFDGKVRALKREEFKEDFPFITSLADEFSTIMTNYNLDLENIFVYFRDEHFVIDHNGFKTAEEMFRQFYRSERYPESFWMEQFADDYHMKVFPTDEFKQSRFDSGFENEGLYIPVIVKNRIGRPYYAAAFVRADRMFDALQPAAGESFYLLDDTGQPVFTAGVASETPEMSSDSSHALRKGHYYFQLEGDMSGLTYVSVVPDSLIAAQMARMNMLLLAMLALSVAISVAVAVLLSVRFKNPVQRILEGLRQMNPSIAHGSSIQEFKAISDSLRHILQSLDRKDLLLRKYGYLGKVKSIQAIDTEMQNLIDTALPFHLILFQFHQNSAMHEGQPVPKAPFFLEFINLNMNEVFPRSITMQTEKDRMVSIVFSGTDIAETIMEKVAYMKKVFDLDKIYYRFAIAFQERLWEPHELTQAYEAANFMLRKRKLDPETQIITVPGTVFPINVWTPDLERNFTAGLVAGNDDQLNGVLDTLLEKLTREEATLYHYRLFTGDLVSKLYMALMEHKIDTGQLHSGGSLFDFWEGFYTLDDYETFIRQLAVKAAAIIREKREARDPIVDFVIKFIEEHYGEDIYHELIADRLHISTSYLRNYFKEKTGHTLSDYLFEYRIEKAKKMLVETEELIQDIAAKVGYQNANSFTRMFRRLTGLTPGEYRRDRHIAN